MFALHKSLLLAGLISFAPALTFTATNPEPTESETTEQELAGATPLISIDLNQLKELAIPYLASLLPINKDTLTFAHTNADAICKELLFNLDHMKETLPARKKAMADLLFTVESLGKHLIMLPAPDLQTALKNPKTNALLQELAKRVQFLEMVSMSAYPVEQCPLMNQTSQVSLAALHKLAADLWLMAKENGSQYFTQPMKHLTIQEKARAIAVLHELILSLNHLISHASNASLACTEQSRKMIEALGAVLKDEALYNALIAKIDQSQRTTGEEKFCDALISMTLESESINSAAIEQLRQAYTAHTQAVTALIIPEQEKLTASIIKLQQLIFDLFVAKRAAK